MTSGVQLREQLLRSSVAVETRLDLAGVSTPVLEAGSGPPVVLLHGQGNVAPVWLPVMERLAATHRVIAPDLPGLGASELHEPAATVMAWLSQLIDKTCDTPPALVGMSLGGSIAARFGVDHSGRLARLVLVSSGSLGPRPPLPVLLPLVRHSARPTERSARRIGSIVMEHPERGPAVYGERFGLLQEYLLDRARDPGVKQANRRLLREFGLRRIDDADLDRIDTPTTALCGRHDRVMLVVHAERAATRHGWGLQVIEDAGHVVFVDQFEASIAALRTAVGG